MLIQMFDDLVDKLNLAFGRAIPGWAIMSAVAGSYLGAVVALLFALRAPAKLARVAVRASRRF